MLGTNVEENPGQVTRMYAGYQAVAVSVQGNTGLQWLRVRGLAAWPSRCSVGTLTWRR